MQKGMDPGDGKGCFPSEENIFVPELVKNAFPELRKIGLGL